MNEKTIAKKPTKAQQAYHRVAPFSQITKLTRKRPDLTDTAMTSFTAKVKMRDADYYEILDDLDYANKDLDPSGNEVSANANIIVMELTEKKKVRVVLLKNAEILFAKTYSVLP